MASSAGSTVTEKALPLPQLKKDVAMKEKGGSSKPSSSRKRPRDEHKPSNKPSSKKSMKSAEDLSPHLLQMFEIVIEEGSQRYKAQLLKITDEIIFEMLDRTKIDVENIVNEAKKSISDIWDRKKLERSVGFDLSYARKLSSLSKGDAETLDQKWKAQMFMEMETVMNRATLVLEEYRLRSPQFSHL